MLSAEAIATATSSSVFDPDPDLDHLDDEDTTVPIDLPPPPPPGGPGGHRWQPTDGRPLAEVKAELRAVNAELARQLARYTGMTHQEVNGRLNREASITRIADATADQLQLRAERAEKWFANL